MMVTQILKTSLLMKQEENLILRQNDVWNEIVFLFDSKLDNITSAEFRLIKPDNTFVILTGTVEENMATFTITEQCCVIPGRCHFNLRLINSSANIYTYVSNCIIDINLNLEDGIESTAEANGYTFPDDFLTSADLSNYATKTYVDTAIVNVPVYTPINYSFTEQKTGRKWVDGKDEYERTLNPDLTLTGSGQIVMSMDSIDTIIDVHPILVTRDGAPCQSTYSPNDAFVTWAVYNGDLIFFISSNFYNVIKLKYVIVKYTKSS